MKWTLVFSILLAVAAIIFWRWQFIISWLDYLVAGTWNLFGWGLVCVFFFLLTVWAVWLHKQAPAGRNVGVYLLNDAAVCLVIWGILGFFGIGGSIGTTIFPHKLIGILRISGLVVISFTCSHYMSRKRRADAERLKAETSETERLKTEIIEMIDNALKS